MSKKILHIAETIKGGIATYLDEVIPALQAVMPDADIMVAVPDHQAEELPTIPKEKIIGLKDIERSPIGAWRFFLQIHKVLNEQQPDVLHIHSSVAGALVAVSTAKCNVRRI